MARIILSELVNDIRNSVQAHTYGIWKGVHYIRAKTATVGNPRSNRQGKFRQQVEKNSRTWFGTLTTAQRNLWEALAKALGSASSSESTQGTKQIIPFNRNKMSGFNAFIMTNGLLESIAAASVEDAPLGVDAPPQPFGVVAAYVVGPPEKITLIWDEPVGIPAGTRIRVWGMSRKFCHKQLINDFGVGVKTAELTSLRGAGGEQIGLPADYYSFQLDAVNTAGLKSAGSNIAEVNVV